MATLSYSVAATVVAMETGTTVAMETGTIPSQIILRPMLAARSQVRLELEQLLRVAANAAPTLLSQILRSVFRILSQRAVAINFL